MVAGLNQIAWQSFDAAASRIPTHVDRTLAASTPGANPMRDVKYAGTSLGRGCGHNMSEIAGDSVAAAVS